MKKTLLFLVLIFTLLASTKAGYIIRGVNVSVSNLKNFTLTIDGDGTPVSAGSVHTGSGSGLNTIVLIHADYSSSEKCFPLSFFPSVDDFDIEVRDLHYYNDGYVLCGARITEKYSVAFVAEIYYDNGLGQLVMNYIEHPEVSIYYSICIPICPLLDYYACGKSGNYGAICSINKGSLQLTNFYTTGKEEWEYHKIIEKPTQNCSNPYFVASGRNLDFRRIGFTTLDISFNTNTYVWDQYTEPESLVAVCDYYFEANKIVLASSYQGYVTLNPVIFPVSSSAQISAYQYGMEIGSVYLQDIGMSHKNDIEEPLISVAGFVTHGPSPSTSYAWHGDVRGISNLTTMTNNNYSRLDGFFEHHKIRYDQMGKTYTGGVFQGNLQGNYSDCALFGTPLEYAPDCDHHYGSNLYINNRQWSSFDLVANKFEEQQPENFGSFYYQMDYDDCPPFKGGSAPEFAMTPPEKESEITTFYDRISVKDTRTNTIYQIYTITGQLIQTGTTNPDISTTQLSRGMYILRLENGKAFKFVK